MLGSYVCRQCRARLSRRVPPVPNPNWQPRATFTSLLPQKPKDNAQPAGAGAQPQDQHGTKQEEYQNRPKIAYTPVGEPSISRGPRRYLRHAPDDGDNGTGPPQTYSDTAENAQREDLRLEEESEAGTSCAQSIHAALSKGRIDQAWSLFEENYTSRDCKALTEPSHSDAALLSNGGIFLRLLSSVNAAFCRGHTNLAVTPTVVLFRYEQLGIARPEYWARQTLACLTHHVIQAVNASTNKPQRDLPSLLFELLSVWRLFFQCMGGNRNPLETISTDWQLPAPATVSGTLPDSRDFSVRLQQHHPKYVGRSELSFCAVYLYSISDALNSVESLQQQAAPLLQFFERLLAGSNVSSTHMEKSTAFSELPVDVQVQIEKEILAAPRQAMAMIGSKGVTLGKEDTGDAAANLEELYLKRIARAIGSRTDAQVLDSLWKLVEKDYELEGQKVAIPLRIYNAFLAGYMVLFKSPRTVEIWNHMIAHGVKPDMQSWVALLHGCAEAKDFNGLNAMWNRMLGAGVEPDHAAWNTRVNGLISLKQVNLGLAALNEMGKRWLSAETAIKTTQTRGKNRKGLKNLPISSKAVNNCAKPTVEVINGAISALVQIGAGMRHEKRIEFVQKILGWAGNFEIKPDARTYNSLIQLYLYASDYATAFRVLRQMEKDGVQADIATYGMLITTAFNTKQFDKLSQPEQGERVLGVFNDLEAAGIKLNDYIYATAIDKLLKQYSNSSAVRAIFDHMTSRNLIPSAYAYTSLITHYFQQQPPAIRAVDGLVHQLFTSHRMPSDRMMFERLIEGYAEHGETGKMMTVLMRMGKQGKVPVWTALTAVVRALINDGDFERARAVVRDVESGEGVAQGGVLGGELYRNIFFRMVQVLEVDVDDESRGAFSREDRAMDAREDEGLLDRQSPERIIWQTPREEEAQEDAIPPNEYALSPKEYEPQFLEAGRQPGSVHVEDEEDVHGFLTDESEPQLRRAQ